MRILDLFCGAGGASMGLHRAFSEAEITGVDINPQSRYPFKFIQADALKFPLDGYDFVWASPPCQRYTKAGKEWRKKGYIYPDLIGEIRKRLISSKIPFVIENVPGSPLIDPIFLNGSVFGLLVHRPRFFECSFFVRQPHIPPMKPVKMGRPIKRGDIIQPVGHFSGVWYAQEQMEIPWMGQKDLAQAIPPAYSEYIGNEYKKYLLDRHSERGGQK